MKYITFCSLLILLSIGATSGLAQQPNFGQNTPTSVRRRSDGLPVRYQIVAIPLLPQTSESKAIAINNNGVVVGNCRNRAFLWDGTQLTEVTATPPSEYASLGGSETYTSPKGINDKGQVVFEWYSTGLEPINGVRDPDGRVTWLKQSDGSIYAFEVTTIGDSGAIAGFGGGNNNTTALFWQNATFLPKRLPALVGQRESRPLATNAQGSLVGAARNFSEGYPNGKPVLWKNGRAATLALPQGAGGESLGINNAGLVCGSWFRIESNTTLREYACVWANGKRVDFGAKIPNSRAIAVNDQGEVVGYTREPSTVTFLAGNNSPKTWFLWTPRSGVVPLSKIIAPGSSWKLLEVTGINKHSQIVGTAINSKKQLRAVLLTPEK